MTSPPVPRCVRCGHEEDLHVHPRDEDGNIVVGFAVWPPEAPDTWCAEADGCPAFIAPNEAEGGT